MEDLQYAELPPEDRVPRSPQGQLQDEIVEVLHECHAAHPGEYPGWLSVKQCLPPINWEIETREERRDREEMEEEEEQRHG
eukprot:Skav224204  [mRNA]  locus=scaffold939:811755:812255:- [translate_table: standard]